MALTAEEAARITALASDIPALWQPSGTIHWAGGYTSQHQVRRPVRTYGQLEGFEQLMDRVVALRQVGYTTRRIAEKLDAEGFRPPRARGPYNAAMCSRCCIVVA